MIKTSVFLGTLVLAACVQARSFHHDPLMAAEKAEQFARLAFVAQDFEEAYALLSPQFKRVRSQDDFTGTLKQLHEHGFPTTIEVTDFGHILGQPAMSIFAHGVSASGDIYYRLIMHGTVDQGYSVDGFMRGDGEYPQTMRTPLPNRLEPEASVDGSDAT